LENYIQADNYELWMIIENGPYIPIKTTKDARSFLRNQMSSTRIASKR